MFTILTLSNDKKCIGNFIIINVMILLTTSCQTHRSAGPDDDKKSGHSPALIQSQRADSSTGISASAPSLTAPGKKSSKLVVGDDSTGFFAPLIDDGQGLPEIDLPTRNLGQLPAHSPLQEYSLPMDMTKDIEAPEETVEVKFNFDAESIVNVTQMFSLTLDFQYFFDPAVSGSVTMTIAAEMTRKEAWELFEHILWISGAYASKHHGFINILPFAKMPQERRLFAKHDPIPNVNVELIRLFNTAASDIANLIRPFMTQGATASPIQYLNSLLIIEAPPNMPKLRELIEQLDVLGETKWPQISLPCRYVESSVILEELKTIMPILGFSISSSERGDGHSVKLISLDRLQILVGAAPTPEVLGEIKRWVEILDREDTVESERIFFYDVNYNTADDLSEHIGVFFNASRSSTGNRAGRRDGGTTPRPATGNEQQQNQTGQRRQQSRSTSEDIPTTVFDIPVTVLADGNHNRLIIRTTPRAYAVLEALLARLDSPPKQVLIQVTIAEINLKKNTEFGFSYAAVAKEASRTVDINLSPSSVATAPPFYNLSMIRDRDGDGNIDSPGDFLAFIQAVAGKTNTKVLFTPQIIAISDEEASINVGDSIPIATRTDSGDDTTSRNFTDVQYQDTGIILTVTPHITAKKLVTLDLRQEVSDAVSTQVSTINSPTIQTRTVETSLVIEDGRTVLLGGLISTDNQHRESGVPFIKDIPFLGKLFSFDLTSVDRTELLLLITVNVIDINTDVDKMIERYKTALKAIVDFEAANNTGEISY